MSPININLKNVKTDEFAPLPKGRFKVAVYNCTPGRAKSSGQPKLSFEFRVLEPEDMKGKRLWAEMSLQEQALFTLKRYLIATGRTEEQLQGDFEFEPSDETGKELVVEVGHEEYNGAVKARITRWFTADTPTGVEDNLEFAEASLPEPAGDAL